MKLFDKLLLEETKCSYIKRIDEKYNIPEDFRLSLKNFIMSQECDDEIYRLKRGDFLLYALKEIHFDSTMEYHNLAASRPAFYLPPRQNLIRKANSEKRRIVYSYAQKDSYLLKYITFALMDFDDLYEDGLCSFRKDNRTAIFFRKLRLLDPERKKYILQTDFHNYSNSIDQDIALSLVEPLFKEDPEFFRFTNWIMKRNAYFKKTKNADKSIEWDLKLERVSVVQGNPIGSFFVNMYLRDMDAELSQKADIYMRYGDDVAFFTGSIKTALWAQKTISYYADQRHLSIHEEKSVLVSPGKNAEILGIEILPGNFDIGEFAEQKLIRKIRLYQNKQLRCIRRKKVTKEIAMQRMIRFINCAFYGREDKANTHEMNWVMHAFPIITQTNALVNLDHASEDAIRVCGSGKKTDAKYRITYKEMAEKGFRSLVHAYYHGITELDCKE